MELTARPAFLRRSLAYLNRASSLVVLFDWIAAIIGDLAPGCPGRSPATQR
jgi:hypothetical protein